MGNSPRKPSRLSSSHSALDKEIKSFDCPYPGCYYKSKWICNVILHEKIHRTSGECAVPCQVCLKTFGSLVSFFHHLSRKHADKLFCPFCQFVSQDLTKIKSHVLTHSLTFNSNETISKGTTELRCSICSKIFSRKGNLTRHLKDNCCKVNRFPTNVGSLKASTRTSSRDVNGKFWPVIGCNKRYASFTLKRYLDGRQKNNRCRSKPFVSDAKKSGNVPSFKARKTERTDEESRKVVRAQRTLHACQKCSFKTAYVGNLRKHQLVHTGERPFKCPNLGCDYRARWARNLRCHQQKHCRGREIEPKSSIEGKEKSGPTMSMTMVNKTQNNAESSSRSVALACSLCDFIGDSQVSALRHSCEHKTVVILLNRI